MIDKDLPGYYHVSYCLLELETPDLLGGSVSEGGESNYKNCSKVERNVQSLLNLTRIWDKFQSPHCVDWTVPFDREGGGSMAKMGEDSKCRASSRQAILSEFSHHPGA